MLCKNAHCTQQIEAQRGEAAYLWLHSKLILGTCLYWEVVEMFALIQSNFPANVILTFLLYPFWRGAFFYPNPGCGLLSWHIVHLRLLKFIKCTNEWINNWMNSWPMGLFTSQESCGQHLCWASSANTIPWALSKHFFFFLLPLVCSLLCPTLLRRWRAPIWEA